MQYEDESESEFKNKLKPQPKSSWQSYDDIPDLEGDGKDFESLINAPVSEGGHFSFKGEKDWIFDISQSSELFSLNKRLLNAAVSCIPFNECIGLEDTYFSVCIVFKIRYFTLYNYLTYFRSLLLEKSIILYRKRCKKCKNRIREDF